MSEQALIDLQRNTPTYMSFLEWVEGTNLFLAIRQATIAHLQNTLEYPSHDVQHIIKYDNTELRLLKGVIVRKPEDLPRELLFQFFMNSPFYPHNLNRNQQLKTIEDGE